MDKYSSYDNGEKTHTIFIFPTLKLLDPTELHTLLQGNRGEKSMHLCNVIEFVAHALHRALRGVAPGELLRSK